MNFVSDVCTCLQLNVYLYTVNCNIYMLIFYAQKIETMEHRMYTHTLDKSPELEKLFNLYSKKSEVSILCIIHNVYMCKRKHNTTHIVD